MKRGEMNVKTGEYLEVDMTPEEVAAIQAAALAEQINPERLKRVADQTAVGELKADTKFQNLISKTPAQAQSWVENSFPSLTRPEQRDLTTIVIAVGVLGRRL